MWMVRDFEVRQGVEGACERVKAGWAGGEGCVEVCPGIGEGAGRVSVDVWFEGDRFAMACAIGHLVEGEEG